MVQNCATNIWQENGSNLVVQPFVNLKNTRIFSEHIKNNVASLKIVHFATEF